MTPWTLAFVIITIALIFDYINGFHDAANSIATIVATRVLTPLQAVLWAAFFNFAAAFVFGAAVARTVGKGFVNLSLVTPWVILAALLGAIAWDLITWWWGLPTSSSHALIGGYAGAAMAHAAWTKGFQHAIDGLILGRGFTPETNERFDLGFCSRGMLKDRVAIPLQDAAGRLIGYAGRVVDDSTITEDNPRYRFPGERNRDGKIFEFRKTLFLYNGYRIKAPVDDLVVVEGFTGVWCL